MPPNEPPYRLTPRARDDLLAIAEYTEARWGKDQRNAYLREMEGRFCWLADNPALGRHRPDVKEGYYCYPQGRHLIFYLISDHTIDIIGVPHQQMDSEQYP